MERDIEYEILVLNQKIEGKESRINQGIITNDKTLSYAKKDIKRWKKEIEELRKQI